MSSIDPRLNKFFFLVTNARSLAPKANSLATNMNELDAWLKEGNRLDRHLIDLDKGENLNIIHRSRRSKRGKNAGAGIAIVYDKTKINLKEYKFKRDKCEIVGASGKMTKT